VLAEMNDTASTSARVSNYWREQFAKNRLDNSLWTNNQIVVRHIYRLITGGSEEHWLPWFLNSYLPPGSSFDRSLSICCGDGAHELVLAQSGRVGFVHGFDISQGAIAQAIVSFESAGINQNTYRFELANADDLRISAQFDLMLSTGALHHVTNLEGLLSRLSEMLDPEGYFVVLEYVGPNRFQWTDRQIAVINRISSSLDVCYLKDHARIELGRPSLDEFLAIDPSEAVRSEDVLGQLHDHFTIEYLRNFNGTVMHPLYPLLNAELTNANAPDFDSVVRMILLIEDMLVAEQVLSSDFVFAICRRKGAGSLPRGRTDKQQRVTGYLDLFDRTRIGGWAADLASPERRLTVDIYIDDHLHTSVVCEAFRQDLADAHLADGCSSFDVPLSLPRAEHPRVAKLVLAGTTRVLATRLEKLTDPSPINPAPPKS
jgi:SAM-dependent methyltransferase